ncbi:MAG: hypothetical protein ACI82H_000794 [Alphaproteobacteria bacterium]|jgi:hypothetical protein
MTGLSAKKGPTQGRPSLTGRQIGWETANNQYGYARYRYLDHRQKVKFHNGAKLALKPASGYLQTM